MRLPNGYGSVHKLSGNRRKPWRVVITVGWNDSDNGAVQDRKTLGCYATKEEALAALAEYHADPYDLSEELTFSELYQRWSAEKYAKTSKSNIASYNAAYKACEPLHAMVFRNIRLSHLQGAVDSCGKGYATMCKITNLLNQLYDYAIQNDICEKKYSKYVDISQYKDDDAESIHRVFTADEIAALWNEKDRPCVGTVLMLIYSGLRVGELLALKCSDVDIEHRTINVGKAKTAAGVRIVPMAEKTVEMWRYWVQREGKALITDTDGEPLTYFAYTSRFFKEALLLCGITDHLPHDTRHTCVSMLQAADVNITLTKRIVGHALTDVTEKVYTHVEIEKLLEAINKI